jgi:protein-L-isoaspartate(D-aspartate) O-methyltransferase
MKPSDSAARLIAARKAMVDHQIRARGVRNPAVLNAMFETPRERFLDLASVDEAYADRALPIPCGQTISQPYIVAMMTEALELTESGTVLEIGTGSGYQTAILARLAGQVHTVERIEELSAAARERLADLGVENVHFHVGDGTLGWPAAAPYDAIIVTAGAPRVPEPLVAQLKVGGRLVVPVGDEERQTLVRVERTEHGTTERPLLGCRFVKLIGEAGWEGD